MLFRSLGDWGPRCRPVYEAWAAGTVGRLGIEEIRLGARGDMPLDGLRTAAAIRAPAGTYSDAQRQVILALGRER